MSLLQVRRLLATRTLAWHEFEKDKIYLGTIVPPFTRSEQANVWCDGPPGAGWDEDLAGQQETNSGNDTDPIWLDKIIHLRALLKDRDKSIAMLHQGLSKNTESQAEPKVRNITESRTMTAVGANVIPDARP